MTLQEAINSGKRFSRPEGAALGEYLSASEYLETGLTLDEYNATDYELEPEVAPVITLDILAEAWNEAKGSRTSMANAQTSQFFKDLVTALKAKGVL